jgi:hypothetical protein
LYVRITTSPIFLRAIISYFPSRYHLLSSFALSSPIFLRAIISYLPSRYHLVDALSSLDTFIFKI